MQAELRQAWRRGAVALAIPALGLLALALLASYGAAARALYDERAAGTVTEVNLTKVGSRPTIEYAVAGQIYQAHTAWPYRPTTFAIGQPVTVRYPPARPSLGMLDSFAELWPLPLTLLAISLLLLVLAWKARCGLRPLLHVACGFGLCILGAVLGLTLFSVLCIPGGFEIFAGKSSLVSILGGMLLFYLLVPVGGLAAAGYWHWRVPARCRRCTGGIYSKYIGRRMDYSCPFCGSEH